MFLKILENTQESTCSTFSFLMSFQACGLRPATQLKKRLWHRCFPVILQNFLRTSFFIKHLWWLLFFWVLSYWWDLNLVLSISEFCCFVNSAIEQLYSSTTYCSLDVTSFHVTLVSWCHHLFLRQVFETTCISIKI